MIQAVLWFPTVLAQTKPSNPTPALIWAGILIVCAMLGGVIVLQLRRRMVEQEQGSNASASLMESLRDMHRRGEISEEEYEQTRKSIASRVSAMLDTRRSDGLFELPDPKRRIGKEARASERGPIAPPTPPVPPRSSGKTDMPPGYEDDDKPGRESAHSGDRP